MTFFRVTLEPGTAMKTTRPPAIALLAPLPFKHASRICWQHWALPACLTLALIAGATQPAHAAATEHEPAKSAAPHKTTASAPTEEASAPAPAGSTLGGDLRQALKDKLIDKKSLILVIKEKPGTKPAPKTTSKAAAADITEPTSHAPAVAHAPAAVARAPAVAHAPANPRASRDYIRAKAAAMTGHEVAPEAPSAHGGDVHGGEVHWSYQGENGPQNWGKLKPEFSACAVGKRQSPINIEESATLHGPAEPLQFNYTPSSGTVVNNGHTIQVDLQGDNTLTVRGQVFKLVQFHFHTPSEEQVNYRNFAMVAHLVHKSADGQLAVVAVLLDPGVTNALMEKVWTYMPLDTNDRVRLPTDIINVNELLPKDQRYYQFIGSLTTPPCTEGVLWMVLKTPTPIGKDQLHLFQQLYPSNARPVQPVNARPVRNAQ